MHARGAWRWLVQWLWRGQPIRAVRARLSATQALQGARQRARGELTLGLRAEQASEPFGPAPSVQTACERYAEAARCALEALPADTPSGTGTAPRSSQALLLRAARGDKTRLDQLRAQLQQPSADCAALPAAEQAQRAAELRAFASVLVEAACADDTSLRRLRQQRRRRLAAGAALLALGLWHAVPALDGADWRTDLAAGKPWRASSAAFQCEPEAKRCGDHLGMSIFFHTAEDASPWLIIDLEQAETVSAVRVRNRTDCCSSLALPLVLELSSDGQTWREVARRERKFRNWVPGFAPTTARWVRLRVDRRSALHLEQVSVYR